MERRYPFGAFPKGWFVISLSQDIGLGEVRPLHRFTSAAAELRHLWEGGRVPSRRFPLADELPIGNYYAFVAARS